MTTFSIPLKNKQFYSFTVPRDCVLIAGSRHRHVPQQTCKDLLQAFDSNGFTFYVGCANGVDRSFRRALSQSPYQDHCFVACAFKHRTYPEYSYGLYASVVVPPNLPPVAALFRRTIWLVTRCAMVLLFPENHNNTWGKGSRLVFKSALFHLKPVFVVAENAPKESMHYRVLKSNLFGVVDGFWVVPHTYEQGGTCDEEY
jgi:hypothetical protein